MKWIAAILMVFNVTLFLWANGKQVHVGDTEIYSQPDVNKEGMLLLSEAGNLDQPGEFSGVDSEQPENGETIIITPLDGDDEQTGSVAEEVQIVQAEDVIPANPDQTADELPESNLVLACFRVGPFKKEESWETAKQWMNENDIAYRHITSDSRELRAVRVYLGPYNSVTQAEPVVNQLKEKDLEHFVYLVDDGKARISLGYFTQEELATKFLDYLNTIKIVAKSQPEYRILGPFNWMEIPVGAVEEGKLISHQWEENSVSLSQVNC